MTANQNKITIVKEVFDTSFGTYFTVQTLVLFEGTINYLNSLKNQK